MEVQRDVMSALIELARYDGDMWPRQGKRRLGRWVVCLFWHVECAVVDGHDGVVVQARNPEDIIPALPLKLVVAKNVNFIPDGFYIVDVGRYRNTRQAFFNALVISHAIQAGTGNSVALVGRSIPAGSPWPRCYCTIHAMLKKEPAAVEDPIRGGLPPLPPLEEVPSNELVQHNDDIVTIVEDVDGIRVIEDSADLRVPLVGEPALYVPSPPRRPGFAGRPTEREVRCDPQMESFARAAGIHVRYRSARRGARTGKTFALVSETAVCLITAARRLQFVLVVSLEAIAPLLEGITFKHSPDRLVGNVFVDNVCMLPRYEHRAEQAGEFLARLITTDYNIDWTYGYARLVRRTEARPMFEVVVGLCMMRDLGGTVGPPMEQVD
jgi:hypothetical protein